MLNDLRHLIEAKARQARHQYGFAAMAERAEKIGFYLAFGEKFPVDARIVEAGHRPPASRPSARAAMINRRLKAAIAECRVLDFGCLAVSHNDFAQMAKLDSPRHPDLYNYPRRRMIAASFFASFIYKGEDPA